MEEDECRCQIELDRTPSLLPNSFKSQDKQLIDFGKVYVGQKRWVKCYILNKYNETIEYTITRDPTINPLYHVFNFSTYKFTVPPNRTTTIKISYAPLYPDTGDVDCFRLASTRNDLTVICAQGTGIGPRVQLSKCFLRFDTTDEKNTQRYTVELSNESEITATLFFDVDLDDPVFRMEKHRFTIPGKRHVYASVNFTPLDYGVYQRRIVCLILDHEPLVLEFFGVHSRVAVLKDHVLVSCPQKRRLCGNYRVYMEDVQVVMQEDPLFSLTDSYIDFGGVSFNNVGDLASSRTITTSMTNHMGSHIFVKFDHDPIFSISPKEILIPPSESTLFECTFTPDKPDFMFNKKHTGSVYWRDERAVSIEIPRLILPLPFSLRLIGHSFSKNKFWLPQLEIIPEVIVLPPTIPGEPSFFTFELRNGGYLPVGFKFLPPKKTNFIIKPMLGLVTDFRLLIAQLQSEQQQQSKIYVEKWSVMLNDRSDHLLHFYLKGFAETPELTIGDRNRVKFGRVQTGCTERLAIPVKNNCQHRLRYKFMIDDVDYLRITNAEGELAPNETVRLDWYYHSTANVCAKYTIVCLVHVLKKLHEVSGMPYEVPVEVYTESYISELCCIPNYYNLGTIECQKLQLVPVSLQNFGPSIVHYILETDGDYGMNLNGIYGTINPGERAEILADCAPSIVGERVITVKYRVRKSADSPEVLPNFEKTLFTIRYNSLYPYMHIVDIVHHNFGQLFPKTELWDLFNIDSLNDAFRHGRTNSTHEIELRTPDNQLSVDDYFVYFLVKNMSPFDLEVELKRRKVCDCPLLEVAGSLTTRKKQFACHHRDAFAIYMDNTLMQPNAMQMFKISLRYILEGSSFLSYELKFTSNRRFFLNFTIKSLSDGDSVLSIYSPKFRFNLSPVCLSENNPQIQAFWFYNNTEKEVEYSLDLEEIDNVNCVYERDIFACLNPEGVIESFSRMPLLFKFAPIKRKTITVKLPLLMGNEETVFLLSGDGTKSFRGFIRAATKIARYDLNFEVPIQLSEDYLQLSPMPVWSSSSAVVFIRNSSSNSVIGYSWRGYGIEGIFEARMKRKKGVLSPGDSHLAILEVRSFGKPCKLRFLIVCKLLNHNEYYMHKTSLAAYNCKQEQIKDEFTITEAGVTYPINDVYVHPFPKQFYTSFAVDIVVTSTPDRDIHHTPREQMTHALRNTLPIEDDPSNICFEFPHMSQESIFTIYTYFERKEEADQSRNLCRGGRPVESSSEEEEAVTVIEEKFDDEKVIDFYKDTLECLIADTIFSTLFLDILKLRRHETPIYYEQIRTKIDDKSKRRDNAIQELFVQPPMDAVNDLFQEMLLSSLNDVFEINLQTKNLSHSDLLGEIQKYIKEC